MPAVAERNNDGDAHDDENSGDGNAKPAGGALRRARRREAPLTQKIPNAYSEVDAAGGDADEVEDKEPDVLHRVVNVGVRGHAVRGEALVVQMPSDKKECQQAGPALQSEHAVAD